MIEDSQRRNQLNENKVTDHLEDPVIQASGMDLSNDPSSESLVTAKDNIKISEILKQKQDISQLINSSQNSQDKQNSTQDDTNIQEPAFIPSTVVDEPKIVSDVKDDQQLSNLIPAKVKQTAQESYSPESVKGMLKNENEAQKLVEKLTNEMMKELLFECVQLPHRSQ